MCRKVSSLNYTNEIRILNARYSQMMWRSIHCAASVFFIVVSFAHFNAFSSFSHIWVKNCEKKRKKKATGTTGCMGIGHEHNTLIGNVCHSFNELTFACAVRCGIPLGTQTSINHKLWEDSVLAVPVPHHCMQLQIDEDTYGNLFDVLLNGIRIRILPNRRFLN